MYWCVNDFISDSELDVLSLIVSNVCIDRADYLWYIMGCDNAQFRSMMTSLCVDRVGVSWGIYCFVCCGSLYWSKYIAYAFCRRSMVSKYGFSCYVVFLNYSSAFAGCVLAIHCRVV